MGVWSKRWRFIRLPVAERHPRDRALGRSSFGNLDTARRPMPQSEQSHLYSANVDFPEIPFEFMDPHMWQTAKIGRWGNRSEHITVKEGRCLVLSARRLSRDSQKRGMRNLMLVDNLALATAISKGRARDYTMLRICQQVGALT